MLASIKTSRKWFLLQGEEGSPVRICTVAFPLRLMEPEEATQVTRSIRSSATPEMCEERDLGVFDVGTGGLLTKDFCFPSSCSPPNSSPSSSSKIPGSVYFCLNHQAPVKRVFP